MVLENQKGSVEKDSQIPILCQERENNTWHYLKKQCNHTIHYIVANHIIKNNQYNSIKKTTTIYSKKLS